MDLMDRDPYNFVMNHKEKDLEPLKVFVHRTFNGEDFRQFIISLKHIYLKYGGLEKVFKAHAEEDRLQMSIHHFKRQFFEIPHIERSMKHVSDPSKNSAAKRINILLRLINTAIFL